MNADDIKYIQAEEGRYGVNQHYVSYEDDDIMNEGIAAIDIDEMNETDWFHTMMDAGWPVWRPTSHPLSCAMNKPCCVHEFDHEEPLAKKVSSDPEFGDYETPEDVKTRGGENYHINKQKSKPHSPKNERRNQREKRVKDIRIKESRVHKKTVSFIKDL